MYIDRCREREKYIAVAPCCLPTYWPCLLKMRNGPKLMRFEVVASCISEKRSGNQQGPLEGAKTLI